MICELPYTRPIINMDVRRMQKTIYQVNEGGRVKLVLLEAPGRPVRGVELPDEDVRRALESLVA